MRAKLRILAAIVLLSLLAGCAVKAPVPRPEAPAAIRVCVTPLLEGWLPRLNSCSAELAQSNLLVEVLNPSQHNSQACDLSLSLGEHTGAEPFLFVPAYENIVAIKNPSNPITSLSLASLQSLLLNEVKTWNQLPEFIEALGAFTQSIVRMGYEQDHELTRWLDELAGAQLNLADGNTLALSTQLMLMAVAAEPGALGFVLESQLTSAVSHLPILDENGVEMRWRVPVLAVTQAQPQGDLYTLLECLQGATQP